MLDRRQVDFDLRDVVFFTDEYRVFPVDTEIAAAFARHDYSRYVVGRHFGKDTDKGAVLTAGVTVNDTFCARGFQKIFYPFNASFNFLFAI